MRAALAAVLAVLAVLALGAGTASAATSPNVQPIARLPELTTAISINFIGDTMFVSTVHGLYSYDVSNPASPRLLDAVPHPIWENEDMDVDPVRKRVFISRDPRGFTSPATSGSTFPFGALEIYDASDPSDLRLLNAVVLDAGHTTTCVNRCDFVWTAGPTASTTTQPSGWGGRPVFATDVRDPAHPVRCPAPIDLQRNDGKTDYAHDVQVDAAGVAWVSGAGGVRGYWTEGRHLDPVTGATRVATACGPVPYAGSGSPKEVTSSRFMHNAWRDYAPPRPAARPKPNPRKKEAKKAKHKKTRRHQRARRHTRAHKTSAAKPPGLTRNDVLLATEENITSDCATSGRFVTYDLRGTYGGEGFRPDTRNGNRMKVLDTWTPEGQPGSTGCASSHYFSSRGDGITVNAFYEQGVRFLDTSNPTDIREVGYDVNSDSDTWAAYWHKGFVYVADFGRGVEVLRFTGAPGKAATVRAPAVHGRRSLQFSADVFGGLCPLRAPVNGEVVAR
jgi:hypothetical protein